MARYDIVSDNEDNLSPIQAEVVSYSMSFVIWSLSSDGVFLMHDVNRARSICDNSLGD
jgi:hypothetical protein